VKTAAGNATTQLSALLAAQRRGWSLEQAFYVDPAIFELERQLWFPRQWSIVAHACELPRKGDYVVRNLFGNDVIVVNTGAAFAAYHNVCTHRGSRICREDGHAPMLVCPYHAWSFRLTGELHSRRELPEGVDPETMGLHKVATREYGGMIFCGLDHAQLPDLEPALEAYGPALRLHGVERAKIAVRRSYATAANWKLVLENFFECYHCRPSHPEYFRLNGHVSTTAIHDDAAAAAWLAETEAWQSAPDRACAVPVRDDGAVDRVKYSVYRHPIGLGRRTHSRDGIPVAPLMGEFTAFDGGETGIHFGRFCFGGGYNDHFVLFQFVPRAAEDTDVIATWFVDAEADLAKIDIDALTFLWDVTTIQDKRIIEDNAAGVRSRAYRPGPYTKLEQQSADFSWAYVKAMSELAA
jgi:Rieske 2Fe-2S family protein